MQPGQGGEHGSYAAEYRQRAGEERRDEHQQFGQASQHEPGDEGRQPKRREWHLLVWHDPI